MENITTTAGAALGEHIPGKVPEASRRGAPAAVQAKQDVETLRPAQLALNGICPYYTMFPLEFPLEHLDDLPNGAWVQDPFCGRGTTAYAARILGLRSFGLDVNPVAVAIARSKLVEIRPYAIVRLAEKLLATTAPDPAPIGEFWNLAYHPKTLTAILKLRAGLRNASGRAANALRAIVLGALHGPQPLTKDSYFSNQMQRTFAPKPDYAVKYWTKRGLLAHEVDVIGLIQERAERYYADTIATCSGSAVRFGDARTMPAGAPRFSATVTSPPYFGMDTYVPDQWLRNWFLGGPDRPDYRKEKQLSRGTQADFAREMGKVWRAVAARSLPGAKLVIRFGALMSRTSDPESLIRQSLIASTAPWRIASVASAGDADAGRRQAEQMGETARTGQAVEEIDVICFLNRR